MEVQAATEAITLQKKAEQDAKVERIRKVDEYQKKTHEECEPTDDESTHPMATLQNKVPRSKSVRPLEREGTFYWPRDVSEEPKNEDIEMEVQTAEVSLEGEGQEDVEMRDEEGGLTSSVEAQLRATIARLMKAREAKLVAELRRAGHVKISMDKALKRGHAEIDSSVDSSKGHRKGKGSVKKVKPNVASGLASEWKNRLPNVAASTSKGKDNDGTKYRMAANVHAALEDVFADDAPTDSDTPRSKSFDKVNSKSTKPLLVRKGGMGGKVTGPVPANSPKTATLTDSSSTSPPSKGRKFSNKDLPNNCLPHWKALFISMWIDYISTMQRLYDWRGAFATEGINAVKKFFSTHEDALPTTEDRARFVAYAMAAEKENMCVVPFLWGSIDENVGVDMNKDPHGHVHVLINVTLTPQPPECVALAAAAAERGLLLHATGELVKEGGAASKFSSDNWGDKTADYVTDLCDKSERGWSKLLAKAITMNDVDRGHTTEPAASNTAVFGSRTGSKRARCVDIDSDNEAVGEDVNQGDVTEVEEIEEGELLASEQVV
ncbi:hypothetical protein EW146_g9211 [Bondarzewia mesenterica]|uniref:Uncharacterized protein n=1 Tax=Bondarzewia mesenterica TaxID=1095465 RepID=A0A4S4L8M0_9AGAM|nr:hypothetical protein EW146_g9211 [Bondarzewia mesenterica]